MGKWSTYQLRGSNNVGPALPSPPAPVLSVPVTNVTQTAGGNANTGGTIQLWEAPTDNGPWTINATHSWISPHNWGPSAGFAGLSLKALEIGNGTTYRGTSPWSNTLKILP